MDSPLVSCSALHNNEISSRAVLKLKQQCNLVSKKQRCKNAALFKGSAENPHGLCYAHRKMVSDLRRKDAARRPRVPSIAQELPSLAKYREFPSLSKTTFSSGSKKVGSQPEAGESEFVEIPDDTLQWREEMECVVTELSTANQKQDHPLDTARVYTPMEVSLMARDKMLRLQALYIREAEWIKRRMQMLQPTIKKAMEAPPDVNNAVISGKVSMQDNKDRVRRLQFLREMRALRGFKVPRGKERLLLNESLRLRREAETSFEAPALNCASETTILETKESTPEHDRCKEESCNEQVLSSANHCFKHILSNPMQVLFKKCSAENCSVPVLPITEASVCDLHRAFLLRNNNANSTDLE